MKNENFFNLIERILIIGPAESDTEKLLSKSNNPQNDLSNISSKILEEYKSINLIDENDVYTENINMENILLAKQFYLVSKVICLISPMETFNTTKEILKNIYSIILNQKNSKETKGNQTQICYVYLKDEQQNKTSYKSVIKEYKLLEFYFGFLLNSLKLKKEERSFFIKHIGNNMGKKCFLDFHINSKSFLKIKDFDISLLMDSINVENLIKLYLGLLMEYKIILIFENYETINKIIFALLSLLFPMKWRLPIISYALEPLIDSLEAPFGMICGLHSKFFPLLKRKLEQKLIGEETLVFNLTGNSFAFFPEDFPELPKKITNELKSNFYLILSEKLSISNGMQFANSEYSAIFPDAIVKFADPMRFLNLKFSLIFINCFLEIMKKLEEYIDPVKISNFKKQTNTRIIVSDLIDINKLYAKEGDKNNNPKFASFLDQLTKTIMFTHFFEKYLTRADWNYKYKTIKSYLKLMNSQQDNYKTILNDYNKEKIRNKMINYYDYKYISLEAALKKYLEKAETSSFTSINNKQNAFSPKLLWNKLDIKKINIFSYNYEMFLISEQDEFVNKTVFKTIFSELLKKRNSKAYELEEEENVDRPMINNNETKLKSHLEIIQTHKRKKKEFPSLSLDDKTLYDIYESGLAGINSTFSSKNKINFQRNFENIKNNEFKNDLNETSLLNNQQQSPKFFYANRNINQNIYVNNINITNNFNNLTLNNSNIKNVVCDTNKNDFFSHKKFDCENLVSLSSFNDISNFTYSEKPSNKSIRKGFDNERNNNLKSEIFNVDLDNNFINNNNINSTTKQNMKENDNNNFSNFSNFNNINLQKINLVNKNEMRNSLNLSSFNKKSLSPMRDVETIIQNKLASRNKFFCESGNIKEINSNNNSKLNESVNAMKIENSSRSNKNTQFNIINAARNVKNIELNFDNNNNNSNCIGISNANLSKDQLNYKINNSPKNSVNDYNYKESNEIYSKTGSNNISVSDKTSSASCFSTSSNNKINLKLIPNVEKKITANIPTNNNIKNNIYNKENVNSSSKNSFFLNFLDKSKNIQTHINHSNVNNTNHNNSNINYLNNSKLNENCYNYYNNYEAESFRNSKNLLNSTNQSSTSRVMQSLNDSGFKKNSINSLNKHLNNSNNISLNEAKNVQLKQLNSSKININTNIGNNFIYEAISPTKRSSEIIGFAASAQGKRAIEKQVPGMIKMQIQSKINGEYNFNDFSNNKKIEVTNANMENIKRLSGDDDKDIFGD